MLSSWFWSLVCKMLTFGEVGWRVSGNSLCYFYKFLNESEINAELKVKKIKIISMGVVTYIWKNWQLLIQKKKKHGFGGYNNLV